MKIKKDCELLNESSKSFCSSAFEFHELSSPENIYNKEFELEIEKYEKEKETVSCL